MLTRCLVITMPDGDWAVPVSIIANDRAEYYAPDYGDDVARSLAEDTGPLFASDDEAIREWASNDMNWSDVEPHAREVSWTSSSLDREHFWVNGDYVVAMVAMGTNPIVTKEA